MVLFFSVLLKLRALPLKLARLLQLNLIKKNTILKLLPNNIFLD
ncbi:MAG: hypothetical protein OFPI_01010 [Osedax symbiont Rs2]|nr:MAG: hypothetical protein OFPI_01010 [Osedax symbiont Rs2]